MDLRGANLRGAKLIDADLRGARLEGTVLRGVEAFGANFTDATLANVDAYGSNFQACDFTNAVVEEVKSQFQLKQSTGSSECVSLSLRAVWYRARPVSLAGASADGESL